MYNRIEVLLRPSPGATLIAIAPWLAVALFALIAGSRFGFLLFAVPLSLVGAGWHLWNRRRFNGSRAIRGLLVDHHNLSLVMADGQQITVKVAPESRVGASLSLLKLRPEDSRSGPGGRRAKTSTLVVLSTLPGFHNTDREAFRRLRVWLRLATHT